MRSIQLAFSTFFSTKKICESCQFCISGFSYFHNFGRLKKEFLPNFMISKSDKKSAIRQARSTPEPPARPGTFSPSQLFSEKYRKLKSRKKIKLLKNRKYKFRNTLFPNSFIFVSARGTAARLIFRNSSVMKKNVN